MDFKTFIRTLVVKTNPFFPFSRLNRLPYALAIRRVAQLAESFPGIRSIYLRHGLTRSDWEPGLSDIDFTIILSSALSQVEEYENVRNFTESYHALRHWFPMLGEVDFLGETCCSAWSRFSLRGAEVSGWKLLQGGNSITPAYAQTEAGLRKDSLDHACGIYESQVLRRFHAADCDLWIESRALLRVATKVLRYALGERAPGATDHIILHGSAAAIVLQVLEILDTQAQAELRRSTSGHSLPAEPVRLLDAAARPGYATEKYAGLRQYDSIILCTVVSFSTAFIVLRDGIPLAGLVGELDGIRNICRANGIRPSIVTRSLFQYYLHFFRPREFLELREYRYIQPGGDLLKEIKAPNGQSIAEQLLNQTLNGMLAPARHAAKSLSGAQYTEWVSHAWQSAFLLLYLDTGLVGSHESSVQACRERYPELCDEIARLSESTEASEKHALAVHALLRRCALDINSKISSLDLEYPPNARIMNAQQ